MTPEQERIISSVRSYVGCSLDKSTPDAKTRYSALAQLVARGVDSPDQVVRIKTNCAMFALGILKLVGVKHPLLNTKYMNGAAVSWVFKIGRDLGALHAFHGDTSVLKPGMLLHYATVGKSNDHVEWLLSKPGSNGNADHAGGGRRNNAITEGHSDVLLSSGRPLRYYLDVPALLVQETVK